MSLKIPILFSLSLSLLLSSQSVSAAEVRLAVAANFTAAMKQIAKTFEQTSGHQTKISYGSTGKLYAQILHGAPFDIFLSADQKRPILLQQQQLGQKRFTYATGKLVLWSSDANFKVDANSLKQANFNKLALANPKTAPYGAAAVQVMNQLGLTQKLRAKWVRGDNIAQTHQFVATGNVKLGFVALAQLKLSNTGHHWLIPQQLYQPIHQDALLLNRGKNNPAALALMNYLRTQSAKKTLRDFGYGLD